MRYVWKSTYETGDATVDKQHRIIFDAANAFYAAVRKGKEDAILNEAFDLLLHYVNTHFSDEEDFYERIGCTVLDKHKIEHQLMTNELREIWHEKRQGSKDAATDLDIWMDRRLIPHIITDDIRAQNSAG